MVELFTFPFFGITILDQCMLPRAAHSPHLFSQVSVSLKCAKAFHYGHRFRSLRMVIMHCLAIVVIRYLPITPDLIHCADVHTNRMAGGRLWVSIPPQGFRRPIVSSLTAAQECPSLPIIKQLYRRSSSMSDPSSFSWLA